MSDLALGLSLCLCVHALLPCHGMHCVGVCVCGLVYALSKVPLTTPRLDCDSVWLKVAIDVDELSLYLQPILPLQRQG